jgi:hypothetical protein
MPKLDCGRIAVAALKAPFEEWRLLLRCAAMPMLLYFVLILGRGVISPDQPIFEAPGGGARPLSQLLWLVPSILFEWRWMNGLWYGAGGPPAPQIRGSYIILFTLAALFWLFIDWAPRAIFIWAYHLQGEGQSAGTMPSNVIYSYQAIRIALWVGAVWVTTRLTVWNAGIIDQGRIFGPLPGWYLTRGHGWRIFGIGVLSWIPVAIAAAGIFAAMPAFGGRWGWFTLQLLATALTLYVAAVENAISLLVYRELRSQRDDLAIF